MQKILIVSDTHGMSHNFEKMLEIEGTPDMILHLGDIEGQEDYMTSIAGCDMKIVAGNNDSNKKLPRELLLTISGKRILMVHGTRIASFDIEESCWKLRLLAKEKRADIVMFGHIHIPIISKGESWDAFVINPGSLTYPRQQNRKPSYGVMLMQDNGKFECEIKYIEKN
ncbi:MAG: metallophosphoesterase [Bacteroides sp.]